MKFTKNDIAKITQSMHDCTFDENGFIIDETHYKQKVDKMKVDIKKTIFGRDNQMTDGVLYEHFFKDKVQMESGDCDPHLAFKLDDVIDELSDCLADLIVGNDGHLK